MGGRQGAEPGFWFRPLSTFAEGIGSYPEGTHGLVHTLNT